MTVELSLPPVLPLYTHFKVVFEKRIVVEKESNVKVCYLLHLARKSTSVDVHEIQ